MIPLAFAPAPIHRAPQGVATSLANDPVVDGLVLVTSDPVVERQARAGFRGLRVSQISKRFPSERFEIVAWNADHWIAIDRRSGPLGELYNGLVVSRELLAKGDATGAFGMEALSSEEYGVTKAVFGEWPNDPKTGRPIQPAALGLDLGYRINLSSGGHVRPFFVDLPSTQRDTMRESLRRWTLKVPPPKPRASAQDARVPSLASKSDQFDFVLLVPERECLEATARAVEAIRRVEAGMRREAEASGIALFERYAFRQGSTDLSKPTPSSEMPEDVRNSLRQQMTDGWRSLGFGSRSEALGFLDNVDSFSVSSDIRLRMTLDPGNPLTGEPSTGASYQFLSVPEMYRP